MIEVELPDGRILEVDAVDEAGAARAAKAFLDREKGAQPAPSPVMAQPQTPDIPSPQQTAGIAIPTPGGPAMPETTTALGRQLSNANRSLQIGAQGAGRGAAELAGAPVDLATAALNAAGWLANKAGVSAPQITRPVGGSQQISDLGAAAMDAIGVKPIEESDMSTGERLGYNINRMGVQGAAGSAAGTRMAVNRVTQGQTAPRLGDSFARPYIDDAARTTTGDAAASVGAATGLTGAQEVAPDSALAQAAATVLGGIGGATAAAPRAVPGAIAGYVKGKMASDIPYDPQTPLAPTSNRVADKAAEILRGQALDPDAAAANIAQRSADFAAEGLPQPTSGLASRDPGLISAEKAARSRNAPAFIARDQQLQSAAADSVAEARPAGTPKGDANRGAQRYAESEAAAQRSAAQSAQKTAEARLADAKQRLDAAQQAETTTSAPIAAQRGDAKAGAASQNLDRVVTGELAGRTKAKNAKFDAVDPDKKAMMSAGPIAKTAADIQRQVGALTPEASGVPREFIAKLERLAAKPADAMAPLTGAKGAAAKPVSLGDMIESRKYLNTAADKAQQAGNYDLATNLRTLKRQVNEQIDAAPQSAEAQRYYREEYAPFFTIGPGRVFRDRVQRDSTGRTALPPSQVASFWLNNTEENAAHLSRILHASANRAEGEAAVRNFLISDLAKTVDQSGKVNLPMVAKWVENNAGVLGHFPAVKQEVDQFRAAIQGAKGAQSALKGEVENLAAAVRQAERGVAGTEKAINDGMLGVLLNNSPENAARAVIGSSDPVRTAREMNRLLDRAPPNIRQGVKDSWAAAVADHIAGKIRTTRETPDGSDAVGYAALVRQMKNNEAIYAEIFRDQPGAMNALRRAQKALEPMSGLSTQATRGSPTAENMAGWDRLEVALKAYYGVLEGGGKLRTLKIMARKLMPNDDMFVGRLVERALLEPRIAEALFARQPKAAATPGWNARLTQALGITEGARASIERRDEKR